MTKTATRPWRIALVVSRFNAGVTDGLKQGALKYLAAQDIAVAGADIYPAPGAFEIPLIAKALARSGKYDGVVCLGCVTKHETAHFEFVSLGATVGLMHAILDSEVPIAFGILTTYTDEQARARSAADANNKGIEAAAACIETLETLARIAQINLTLDGTIKGQKS
jgi:6,7-dimethyl-8-ribityllumazine synthase